MPKPNAEPKLPGLDVEKVVITALELLDEVGYEGLTLRRLADTLGVQAAALYWHFKNKQDLIDQMAAKLFQDEYERQGNDAAAPTVWQDVLHAMAHGMRAALYRYRDGAQLVANADVREHASKGRTQLIGRLEAYGLSPQLVAAAMYAVGRYTLGCVFEDQADPRAGDRSRAAQDEQFERGLAIIIAGVTASLESSYA